MSSYWTTTSNVSVPWLRGQSDTIAQCLVSDRAALMPLPVILYGVIRKQSSRVSSQALVRYRTHDYSVPRQYGHQAGAS